jgi:hypothetical protein
MKYKLTLLALLIPTAVFAQSKGENEAAGFYTKTNPGQQYGNTSTSVAAGEGPNKVTPYTLGNVYLNAGLWGAYASGIGIASTTAVTAATPGATAATNTFTGGTTSAANTVASSTTSAANTVASGTSSAANTAASGASSATNSAVSGASSTAKKATSWL